MSVQYALDDVASIICQVLELGAYPFLTTVTVEVTPTFSSADEELVKSFMALTSWNLCSTVGRCRLLTLSNPR